MSTTARPAVGEPADQPQHLLGLCDAERRGGLVEDDELGVPQYGAGDRDGLPLATGQAGDLLADAADRTDREAGEGLGGPLLHGGLVQHPALGQLAAEVQVVHDVEVVAKGEVLVHNLDAQRVCVLGAVHGDRLALEEIVAVVEQVDAGDPLDQGRLAGTVVPDQRGDLTGIGVEVDVLQDVHGAEALVHGAQRQDRLLVAHWRRCRGGARHRHAEPLPRSGVPVVAGTGVPHRQRGPVRVDRAPPVGQEIPAAWQAEAYAAVQTSEAFW
jgi:hypothetical protein